MNASHAEGQLPPGEQATPRASTAGPPAFVVEQIHWALNLLHVARDRIARLCRRAAALDGSLAPTDSNTVDEDPNASIDEEPLSPEDLEVERFLFALALSVQRPEVMGLLQEADGHLRRATEALDADASAEDAALIANLTRLRARIVRDMELLSP